MGSTAEVDTQIGTLGGGDGRGDGLASVATFSDKATELSKPKSEDEALAWLDPEVPEKAAAPKAQAAPSENTADEDPGDQVEEVPAKPAKAPKDEPAAELSAEDESVRETALRALRRAKTPADVIRNLSGDQVVAWGLALAKQQEATDRAYTELHQLKSAPEDSNAAKPSGGVTNTPNAEATRTAHLKGVTTKLSTVLGLDEEGGAVLGESLNELVSPLLNELSARDQRDNDRDRALGKLLLDGSRQRLLDRFPQLGDRAKAEAVMGKASSLLRTGDYGDVDSAVEDAAKIVLHAELAQAQEAKSDTKALAKARGRPMAPSKQTPAVALTDDDRFSIALQQIEAGATPDEARAAAGW